MIPLTFLFQLCIAVAGPDDGTSYDCSIDVYIVADQSEVQAWWIDAGGDPQIKAHAFWDSDFRHIVVYRNDLGSFSQMWKHAWCWMYYYYGDRTNHEACTGGFALSDKHSFYQDTLASS